ncbi:MAG: Lacal_2735 family protein [Flavobacteriaceae bacterium]|nr:Lacal_2735 family protein [Flavobacteriaceae bacterium]
MFGLFKKKSEIEKLELKYTTLLAEWHKLSTINRSQSDLKFAEAQVILDKIEYLKNNQNQ